MESNPSAPDSGARCAVCADPGAWTGAFAGLARCRSCGFVAWLSDGSTELDSLYDEGYFSGNEYPDYLGQQDALRRNMRRHLRQMERYGATGGGALLEVGCAYGLFLDEARNVFDRVVGVDICAAPLRYARDVLRLEVRCGDFTTMSWEGEQFDAVCMWDTIEHLAAPDHFVARAAELLRPGGMLYLTTGDIDSRNARWRGARWRQIHPPSHVSYFSRDSLTRLLTRSGFEVVGVETAAYYHTLYNILAAIRLRDGRASGIAATSLRILGERLARRCGGWIDLGDIMFVAAERSAPA